MLEGDAADLARERLRLRVQRLQARVLHLVHAAHLLHEQQRVRSHVHAGMSVRARPLERRQQTPVLGDVVRRDADRVAELLDERAVLSLDADAIARRSRIAARAAVDVRDDHRAAESRLLPPDAVAPAGAAGTKKRIRWQLSHWTISSLRRTVLNTCGRRRTWQIVQMPSRASATAMPLRRRDTSSKVASTAGAIAATTDARSLEMRSSEARVSTISAASALRSASTAFCSAASAASARFRSAPSSSAA